MANLADNDRGAGEEALDALLEQMARAKAPAGFVGRMTTALDGSVARPPVAVAPWMPAVAAVLVAAVAVSWWFGRSTLPVARPVTPPVASARADIGVPAATIATGPLPEAEAKTQRMSRARALAAATTGAHDLPALAIPAAVEQAAIDPRHLAIVNLDVAPATPISPLPSRLLTTDDGPGGDR